MLTPIRATLIAVAEINSMLYLYNILIVDSTYVVYLFYEKKDMDMTLTSFMQYIGDLLLLPL